MDWTAEETMNSTVHRFLADNGTGGGNSGGGGGHRNSAFSPAVVAIIAVLGSAFLVVSYYRIFAKLCNRWNNRQDEFGMEGQMNGNELDANASPLPNHGLAEVLINKIPMFEYKTGDGFTAETDCPVCLMDFSDNQELRLLPKCAHAFHVSCIDTWLCTHCTCPVCRANIWPEQVMNQFPVAPVANFYDRREYAPPGRYRNEYPFNANHLVDTANFSGRAHGRSSAPTLRGLLNSEDLQHHMMWMSGSSGTEDPGEDSIRLYDSRDHGGDSSSRHHHAVTIHAGAASSNATTSINENSADQKIPIAHIRTESGPQVPLNRTASWKESLGNVSKSRDGEHHKWHIPPRKPSSFRRNPFSVVRSYSMGTSRRLVQSLDFLDLEDAQDASNNQGKREVKLYNPIEYGITEASSYPVSLAVDYPTPDQMRESSAPRGNDLAGPSTLKESFRSGSGFLDSSTDPDSPGAALKMTGAGRGRSISFRSPFTLKRSLSGGRNRFSFRQNSRGRFFSSSGSPPPPGP